MDLDLADDDGDDHPTPPCPVCGRRDRVVRHPTFAHCLRCHATWALYD